MVMESIEHLLGKIHQGDCLEFIKQLPDKCVDLVLTDPPYGINGGNGHLSVERGKGKYTGIFEDTPEYIRDLVVPVIQECRRISKAVIVSPGFKNMMFYPPVDSYGTLHNPTATGISTFGMCYSQPLFYYGKSPTKKNMRVKLDFMLLPDHRDKFEHPCIKPLKTWRQIMNTFTFPGQIVFDPFMGSGTTAVSCEGGGRKWFGCELEPKYCAIAQKRIDAERAQLKLF
jgi:site-specific DNA-methyltransferase (adenine-specific)